MKFTRRDFLRNGAVATAGLALSNPLFGSAKTNLAANAARSIRANEKVLVVVNLFGGNDGLNTVVPMQEFSQYQALRGALAYDPADLLTLSGEPDFTLNPGMTEFQSLFNNGKLAIINGVGVPHNAVGKFDHEVGQKEFQTCDIVGGGTSVPTGWLGRYLDTVSLDQMNPGVDFGGGRLMLTGNSRAPISISTISGFQLQVGSFDTTARRQTYSTMMNLPNLDGGVAEQNRLYRVDALNQSQIIQTATANYVPAVTYPTTWLGTQLRECAKLINANLGAQVMAVGVGGFDTHSGQDNGRAPGVLGYHATLMKRVSDAIGALYADLVAHGHSNRVLILTISEFGRRAYANQDIGTDHGLSSMAFAVGDPVNGGIYGTYPSLQDANLVFGGSTATTTDFRSFYATIIGNWFNADPVPVIGGNFPLMSFV
jgi:uncharacterized protein (DUF1501 family)